MDGISAIFSLQLQCIHYGTLRAFISLLYTYACTGTNPQFVREKMTKRTTQVGVVIIKVITVT